MPLPPGFTEEMSPQSAGGGLPAGFQEEGPDWGGVVKDALNEAKMGNGSKMRALMTDSVTQAKVLPYLAGGGLGVTGVPMGGALGTGGGHLLADAALKSYGREDLIPSMGRQLTDMALAGLGDVTAIPAVNRKIFGGQVGAAERAAKFPPAQDVRSIPMNTGQKTLGDFVNDALDSVKSSGGQGTPSYWMQLKDQVDRIYKLGKDQALTRLDQGRLKFLNKAIQAGMNANAPGRAGPAANLAMSQVVPNAITKAGRSIPTWAKYAMGTGATAAGLGGLGKALSLIGTQR